MGIKILCSRKLFCIKILGIVLLLNLIFGRFSLFVSHFFLFAFSRSLARLRARLCSGELNHWASQRRFDVTSGGWEIISIKRIWADEEENRKKGNRNQNKARYLFAGAKWLHPWHWGSSAHCLAHSPAVTTWWNSFAPKSPKNLRDDPHHTYLIVPHSSRRGHSHHRIFQAQFCRHIHLL